MQTAQPHIESNEMSIMPAVLQKPVNGRVRFDRDKEDPFSPVVPITARSKQPSKDRYNVHYHLDEHMLSPFETDSQSKPSLMPGQHGDHFSISGEFIHHVAMDNHQRSFELQPISPNNSIYAKQEKASKHPADPAKVH